MKKRLTYNEFRLLRDNLPHGAIDIIADRLGITADEVRHYFHASAEDGVPTISGVHHEEGPNGGFVELDDMVILDAALELIHNNKN